MSGKSVFERWCDVIAKVPSRRSVGSDGVPIRDGMTYTEDSRRVLDMLCLCGELGGVGPNEAYTTYLRRLIDSNIEMRKALTRSECILDRNLGHQTEKCYDALSIIRKALQG